MSSYSITLQGVGEGAYTINAQIYNAEGEEVVICHYLMGGAGTGTSLQAQGPLSWSVETPPSFIGQEMSLECFEYGNDLKAKIFQGVAPHKTLVAEGVLDLSAGSGLGVQGGTGTFESP